MNLLVAFLTMLVFFSTSSKVPGREARVVLPVLWQPPLLQGRVPLGDLELGHEDHLLKGEVAQHLGLSISQNVRLCVCVCVHF